MDDEVKRAFAAYFRAGGNIQPSISGSGLMEHNGKRYVMVCSAGTVLAAYRVRNDGMLKRLRRWPKALERQV